MSAVPPSKNVVLVWIVPFHASPAFIWVNPDQLVYENHLCLSDSLVVFYNITESSPNGHLKKFGGSLQNIPGNAIICASDAITGCNVDVSLNLQTELSQIME